jgi:hypothetical protein
MSLPYPLSRAREAQLFRWYYNARDKPYSERRRRHSRVQATYARTRRQAPRYYKHFSGEADRMIRADTTIFKLESRGGEAKEVVEMARKVLEKERGMWKEARRG